MSFFFLGGDLVDQLVDNNFAQPLIDPTNIMDGDYHLKLHHKIGLPGRGHSQPGPSLNMQVKV